MIRDRYPIAREKIVRHFGSITKFCLLTEIPKATVVRVLNGKYGSGETDDTRQRERIERAMLANGVKRSETRYLWSKVRDEKTETITGFGNRRVKITHVTTIEDLGVI